MKNKVCVLTVTYGNRYHLVKQVVERAIEEGVSHCVIVDNASLPESALQLKEFANKNPSLTLLRFEENRGSAGGYKAGLEKIAQDIDCEYILLLDDDNVLEKGALDKLFAIVHYLKDFPHPYALLCYRKLFLPQTTYIAEGCDFSYKFNAFASNNMLKNIQRKIKRKKYTSSLLFVKHPITRIDMAPYGGFFFSRNLLSLLDFPQEDFFVYLDDLEYTYRLTQKGGYIFLCSEITINDIDASGNSQSSVYWLLQPEASDTKLYYYVRNATYLYARNFKTNSLLYTVNMLLWFLRFIVSGFFHWNIFVHRFPLLLRAVHDGHKGKLGKTF